MIRFQEFDDYRDADDACYELNGKDLLGERCSIRFEPVLMFQCMRFLLGFCDL